MKKIRPGYTYSGYYRSVGSFVFLFEDNVKTFIEVEKSVFKYVNLK